METLYVVRHGIAVARTSTTCPPDPERPLTAEGIEKTRAVAEGLRAIGGKVDLIVTSPYRRAAETARIVADVLGESLSHIKLLAELEPGYSGEETFDALAKLDGRRILCVGHAPNVDDLVAYTVGVLHPVTSFKKAGIACIDLAGFPGIIAWLLPPRVLRQLARSAG